jgi:hypothetical protein
MQDSSGFVHALQKTVNIREVNSALRLFLLGIACFAGTILLVLILNSLSGLTTDCYQKGNCQQTPILGTIAFAIDALKTVAYFAIFPLGAVLGRRDFRKTFKSRLYRRAARIAFALLPVMLFPLKYFFDASFF